ncbi:replication initiation factor domain-containing protein [Lacticaseibacillus mingshuiensis]|uniref:Replication initiation factor domain-containing protein n=1 Tax=Lacticaseibacillus mingshuiensis TaxID=2799574 RepID=A0ABW4CKQ1_9LACO|nr:replication initiation factor domain-containing protein [Lacticaseibacillus mingshuiensis]
MEPTLLIGIDEFTMVLTVDKSQLDDIRDWSPVAINVINRFSQMTELETVFGQETPLTGKIPQGYTIGYQYGDNPFYFAIAYHPENVQMGIVVKFSAYAWARYCHEWARLHQSPMTIKQFCLLMVTDDFQSRLSRIDFTADFQNYNFTVDDLYRHLTDGSWIIQNADGKKNPSGLSAHEVNKIVETFYVGSKKGNTRLFMRVYDKRREQMEQPSFRYEEALAVESWVRLEAVFKGKYAHQITDSIRDELGSDEQSMKAFIASKLLEKYRFVDVETEEYADLTVALLNVVDAGEHDFSRLRLESPRDSELIRSIQYLMFNSGLFTTMFKCDAIWGNNSGIELLLRMAAVYLRGRHPPDDAVRWVTLHRKEMAKRTLFELFAEIDTTQEAIQKETTTTPPTADGDSPRS